MTNESVQQVIKEVIFEMVKAAEQYDENGSEEAIHHFKAELRIIRSFMETIRIHCGDRGMKMGDKCKKLYQVASVLVEAYGQLKQLKAQENKQNSKIAHFETVVNSAGNEWKKTYSSAILFKLEKQLLDYNYTKVPPAVLSNLINRRVSQFEIG